MEKIVHNPRQIFPLLLLNFSLNRMSKLRNDNNIFQNYINAF